MGDAIRSRRWIALVAAYAVALQTVLLPLSAVVAAPFAGSLCSAHATSGGAPLPGQGGCPCAAGCGTLCCAHAVLAREPAVVARGSEVFGQVALPRLRATDVARTSDWSPQAPRAPPQT